MNVGLTHGRTRKKFTTQTDGKHRDSAQYDGFPFRWRCNEVQQQGGDYGRQRQSERHMDGDPEDRRGRPIRSGRPYAGGDLPCNRHGTGPGDTL